jgi:hypothetical protein
MRLMEAKFKPGGLNTDVVENEIGVQEFTQVQNLRMNKFGEWVNDRGYEAIKGSLSGITAGLEITDDISGDRFIVYHSGTGIYRLTYDDGDGNGYENESPVLIVLPSGVSFTADDDVKFYWHNRILRIVGGSHPLRYEYINRTLLPDAEELVEEDTFASTTESWSGQGGGSVARVAGGVPTFGGDAFDLEVTILLSAGYGWKVFTIVSGENYVFRCWVQGSAVGDKHVYLGSSQDATDYGEETIDASDTEWRLISLSFTATGTSLYVHYDPTEGQTSGVGHIDNLRLYIIEDKPKLDSWVISKAFVEDTQGLLDLDYWYVKDVLNTMPLNEGAEFSLFGCNILDRHQYTLPFDLEADTGATLDVSPTTQAVSAEIIVDEKMFDDQSRMTGFGLVADVGLFDGDIISSKRVLGDTIDFSLSLEDKVFQHGSLGWELANPQRLKLIKMIEPDESSYYAQNGYLVPGHILKLENQYGWTELIVESVDTVGGFANTTFVYVEVEGPITPLLGAGTTNEDLPSTKITVTRRIEFDGSQYKFWLVLDKANDSDYYDATGFPAGVSDTTYDYKDFVMINGRSFVLSNEANEGDLVRYSPVNMPDVHPSTYFFQTEIGDADENKALSVIDDRLVVLKEKSLSKMSLYGGTMSKDVGVAKRGLYNAKGYIVIDNLLYFMDENDVYIFDGVRAHAFLKDNKVRNYYKDNVHSGSFFLYNKIDNELWLRLSGTILAYSFDFDSWRVIYYSSINPVDWYLSAENEMIGVFAAGFNNYNHSSDTWSSALQCKFVTRLTDTGNPEQYKKLVRYVMYCLCSEQVSIKIEDIDSGRTSTVITTPDTSDITALEDVSRKMLFKNAEITVVTASAANLEFQFRSLLMEFMKWR